MSKYTQDSPFEYGGAKVWPHGDDIVLEFLGLKREFPPAEYQALNAFLDADDAWSWTDDAGRTEARKGRLVVVDGAPQGVPDQWGIFHEDLGMEGSWCQAVFAKDGTGLDDLPTAASDLFLEHVRSFFSWNPPAPAEPSGFGYVGTVTGPGGDEWQVSRYTVSGEVLYERVRLRDGRIKPDQSWKRIVDFGTFTAVTK